MRGKRHSYKFQTLYLLLTGVLTIILLSASSCSTKKNTPLSRNWQAFTTRYNVYFNGSEHYKEQLKSMEDKYEDDYTRRLLTHPAEARADNKMPQPQGDFKRTIEKMQKSIQLHSITKKPAKKSGSAKEKAFRAREEFNPFLHNAWLMLGKAEFMGGDFLGAASTFLYISKHFTWLPEVVTEARLWQARSYCALDWNYEAENVLRLVKEKDLTSKQLRLLYNIVNTDYLIRTDQYETAVPYLREAAKSSSGSQKNRLWFLLGQLYSQTGKRQLAYEAFGKAGGGMSTPYRTKFNARIKQSEVYTGQNIRKEVNALKAMTRYERNKEFLDQIYYAIGNLYLSRGDTAEAKKNYILAVEKSTRSGIDKAMAQLVLGNIYFEEADYIKAQPCYSEAVPQLPETYPEYKVLKKRSDVLDELAVYAGNVELQDSLLRLSELSPEEQEKVAQKIVDELIKQEKEAEEAAKREDYLAQQKGQNDKMSANSQAPGFQMNADKSWYFYNATTKNSGKTEFQRKWGARKLEDDWRRRNKTSFSFDDEPEEETEETGVADGSEMAPEQSDSLKLIAEHENDPHFIEYYLKQIPKTPEEIATANDVIQEGLYNMGVILKDKLEDYPAARKEFNELETRYPDNIYRLDVYYNMYLMAVREDNAALAETWRAKILEDFPESPYGEAMRDPQYFNNLRRMHEVQEGLYEKAYTAYLADDNSEVHELTGLMEKEYPLSPILPKFVFIDALSYLTEGNNEQFQERLTELLQKWPDTDMTDMASGILKGLKAGRVPNAGISNSRGMIWEIRLSDNAGEQGEDGQPANFERDPNSPQYLVLAFPKDSVNANMVLYDVARFNFSSFIVKDFDLEQMSFSNIGLLIIKGFANLREVEHYRNVMARSEINLPSEVRPIMISKANFELLLREGRSFEEYFRFQERSEAEAKEEEVAGEGMMMPPGPDEELIEDTEAFKESNETDEDEAAAEKEIEGMENALMENETQEILNSDEGEDMGPVSEDETEESGNSTEQATENPSTINE